MATINHVVEHINSDAMRVTWAHLTNGDVGQPFSGLSEYADRSVFVFGDGGSAFDGGSVTIQGSPNFVKDAAAAYWDTINSPSETPLNIASNKIRAVLEYVESIRPSAAGGAAMNVTVVLVAKRLRR